jgi:hypothetical protein
MQLCELTGASAAGVVVAWRARCLGLAFVLWRVVVVGNEGGDVVGVPVVVAGAREVLIAPMAWGHARTRSRANSLTDEVNRGI